MPKFQEASHRDTVLFVNSARLPSIEALKHYERRYNKKLKGLIFVDLKNLKAFNGINPKVLKQFEVVKVNFSSDLKLKEALKPYVDRLLAVTCQYENAIPSFKKLIPHVPYLNTPTQDSLDWSTDKVKMRKLLKKHNPKITPKYVVLNENSDTAAEIVQSRVGFPVIVKPSGLAASLLVSVCYHEEELQETLAKTFKKIEKIYKAKGGRGEPQVLIEELMEGVMYSIDVYVNDRGVTYSTPPVHVKTGREVGFDDFFGYKRTLPVKLLPHKVEKAKDVAEDAVHALGLRSTTAHVELMKVEGGWKIIELGPRVGGFRSTMYPLVYNIDHALNDILIRIPQKPNIGKKIKGHTAYLQFYAKTEGKLQAIKGLKKVRALESLEELFIRKKKGDTLKFARHGGGPAVEVSLFNATRSGLLADIRRLEKALDFDVVKGSRR